MRWLEIAGHAAMLLFDDEAVHAISARRLQLAREAGAVAQLPGALDARAAAHAIAGELIAADTMLAESDTLPACGEAMPGRSLVAALRGAEPPGGDLTALAVHANSVGHYEEALAAAAEARDPSALRELVGAAARRGRPERAPEAVERLADATRTGGTDWALGVEAVARALVCDDNGAGSTARRSSASRAPARA